MANVQTVDAALEADAAVDNIRLTLRALPAVREMTAPQLGEILGVSRSRIYDRIQGRKPFITAEVATMADIFQVSVQVFFDGLEALFGSKSRTAWEADAEGE